MAVGGKVEGILWPNYNGPLLGEGQPRRSDFNDERTPSCINRSRSSIPSQRFTIQPDSVLNTVIVLKMCQNQIKNLHKKDFCKFLKIFKISELVFYRIMNVKILFIFIYISFFNLPLSARAICRRNLATYRLAVWLCLNCLKDI